MDLRPPDRSAILVACAQRSISTTI
jgi:hypothetical protein